MNVDGKTEKHIYIEIEVIDIFIFFILTQFYILYDQ